ncbi:flagellar biosynthesis repressor FlbT, partial [Pseudomonas sp. DKN 2791]
MLRITLRDGEKAIVNGAVIRAVGRTQIAVENQVSILRGREIMRPEEATTPARQLYFAAMLAY